MLCVLQLVEMTPRRDKHPRGRWLMNSSDSKDAVVSVANPVLTPPPSLPPVSSPSSTTGTSGTPLSHNDLSQHPPDDDPQEEGGGGSSRADTPDPAAPPSLDSPTSAMTKARHTQRMSATRAMFGRVILYPLVLMVSGRLLGV